MKFKKFMAALCASVMVLGATMTVCAAPSVDTQIKIESTDGNVAVKNEIDAVAEGKLTAAANAVADGKVATVLGKFDIEIEDKNGGTVIFNIAGVKKGDTIKVLHWANGAWSAISKVTVADGKVTATFDSLSPVAIVKVTEKATTGGTTNGGTTSDEEDKTGVGVSAAALAAAAGLAGVVVCKKKSN